MTEPCLNVMHNAVRCWDPQAGVPMEDWCVNCQPSAAARRALMRLPKHGKGMSPRAQVQSLVRSAKRADGQADRAVQYSGDTAKARVLRGRRDDAIAAMLWLNEAYSLGYPVS